MYVCVCVVCVSKRFPVKVYPRRRKKKKKKKKKRKKRKAIANESSVLTTV